MEIKSISVSFTGYRTHKIKLAYNIPNFITEIEVEVYRTIKSLYENGYRRFLSGMAEGFDMIAAEAVLKLQKLHKDIELVAVIPFKGQELKFDAIDILRYKEIVARASEIVYISEYYNFKVYHDRNNYLINNSSALVCFYSGIKGGTQYTYDKAIKKRLEIVNVFLTLDKTPRLF